MEGRQSSLGIQKRKLEFHSKTLATGGAPLELIGSELAGVEPEELGEAGALDAD
jgi:hypothetical protein